MRAVVMERRGPAREALVLHTDWPRPVRKAGQVLVEAAATCVTAGDWKMRSVSLRLGWGDAQPGCAHCLNAFPHLGPATRLCPSPL